MYDYDLLIIMRIAEVLMDEESSEKVRELRLKALGSVRNQLEHYRGLGYIDRLLNGIAEKRVAMIMKTTTKAEMDRVMIPKAPHYNGAEFITDEYHIPEEELIAWSQTSLKGPLVGAGFKRYMELFREFFPEESKQYKLGGVV